VFSVQDKYAGGGWWIFHSDDANHDGYADLASGDVLMLNNGAGVFQSGEQDKGVGLDGLADLDGDGDVDSWYEGTILKNDGTGSFEPSGEVVNCIAPEEMFGGNHFAAADIDNDGDFDLVGFFCIFLNDGKGHFVDSGVRLEYEYSKFAPDWPNTMHCPAPVVADMNNDGYLDVVVGVWTRTNRVWLNQPIGIPANSPPQPPPSSWAEIGDDNVHFFWEPGTDSKTPEELLTYDLRIGTAVGKGDVRSAIPDSFEVPGRGPGNSGHCLSWTLRLRGREFSKLHWAVRTVDSSWDRSDWSWGVISLQ
jgi:hypothetical protein